MKSTHLGQLRAQAMTLMEVTAVIAACGLVVMVALGSLLPVHPRKVSAKRINCVSNIKQIGLAMRMWANDQEEKFPWQVSTSQGGTLEFAESKEIYRHFLALNKELSSPKVLACSSDAKVTRIPEWLKLSNQNLSYFVGLDASETNVQSLLSGDRNILGGVWVTNRVMRFTNGSPAAFGPDLHQHQGNVGLGDGSAQQVTDNSLRKQMQSALLGAGVESLRLSIPKPN